DAPNFKNTEGSLCNAGPKSICYPVICSAEKNCSMSPGAENAVEFRMITPKQDEMKKIKTSPTLSYRVVYDYETKSSFSFPVVNPREIERRQRAQSSLELEQSLITSSGPVSVAAYLDGPSYVLAGQDAVIVFHLVNKGAGVPMDSQIDVGQVEITFPQKLLVENGMNIGGTEVFVHEKSEGESCTSFHNDCILNTGKSSECYQGYKYCLPCSATKWNGVWRTCIWQDRCEYGSGLSPENKCANGLKCCVPKIDEKTGLRQYSSPYFICDKGVCTNRGPIDLYRGSSSPLYFVVKNVPGVDVFETFTINAKIKYKYELRGSENVEVKPYGT
ncbi:MAG: hypothetical protein HZB66_02580, partial [Candidatus Aenigmarchaeota archaeon]|nr:hypothetical protein [Candidatus Aenigmarchaeota archaeon]